MARQIKGWRDKNDWEKDDDAPYIKHIRELINSDDGWICPYCGYKERMDEAELSNSDLLELLFDVEKRDTHCSECGKHFFIKSSMTVKYFSCEDREFNDDDTDG